MLLDSLTTMHAKSLFEATRQRKATKGLSKQSDKAVRLRKHRADQWGEVREGLVWSCGVTFSGKQMCPSMQRGSFARLDVIFVLFHARKSSQLLYTELQKIRTHFAKPQCSEIEDKFTRDLIS